MTIGLTPLNPPNNPSNNPPKLAQDSLKIFLRITGMTTLTGGGCLLLTQTLIQPQAEIDLSNPKETHPHNTPTGQTIAQTTTKNQTQKSSTQKSSAQQWGTGFQNLTNEPITILPISQPEVITLNTRPTKENLEDLQLPETTEDTEPPAPDNLRSGQKTVPQSLPTTSASAPKTTAPTAEPTADASEPDEETAPDAPATPITKLPPPNVIALFPQPTATLDPTPTSAITPPEISLPNPNPIATKPQPQQPIAIAPTTTTPTPETITQENAKTTTEENPETNQTTLTPSPIVTPRPLPTTTAQPTPTTTPTVQPTPTIPQSSPTPQPETIAMVPQTTGVPKVAGAFVEQFKITGSTIFSEAKLNQIASSAVQPDSDKPTINRVLTPAELVQASEAITKLYTDGKYINSGAYIPQEVLQGATPEIRVIEGSIEQFNINIQPSQGFGLNRPLSKNYIQSRLAQATKPPLNLDRLLEATKLLESDPLIGNISVKLEPGNQPGGSILNAQVQQARNFSSELNLSNNRSTSVGSFQQGITLRQANLLGLGDQLSISYDRSTGSRSTSFGYSLPLNPQDGTLSFRYNTNNNRIIEERFSDLDITSSSKLYELKFRQPLLRKPNTEFALSLSGTHYRSENQLLGDPLPGRGSDDNGLTRITALRFGQEYLQRTPKQVLALQSQFSLGINALGATINQEGPDSRFLSWRGQGQYARLLGPDSLFSLRGQLQFADRGLASVEQLSIGGADTVRGYRPNTLLTDNGWLTSAELRLPIARFPKSKGVLQLAPFLDIGGGWNRDGETPKPGLLMSTGLGLVLRFGNQFSGRIDYGIPLTATDRNGQSLRQNGVHFSIFHSF